MEFSLMAKTFLAVIVVSGCFIGCHCEGEKRQLLCDTGELQHENELRINGDIVNVTIGTSPRISDRIFALMLRSYIHDDLGYSAELVTHEYTPREWVENMSCDHEKFADCGKFPMIHIGVAETTEQALVPGARVKSPERAYLGPNIKLGWFITTNQVVKPNLGPSPDHYRYFTSSELASRFAYDPGNALGRPGNSSVKWCNRARYEKCNDDGWYVPERCTRTNVTCATLCASFPHENYEHITTQIDELGLYVKVAWVGYRLDGIVDTALQKNKPLLIFDYRVSYYTANSETRIEVLFPSCDTVGAMGGCIYPNAKLRKLYWAYLDTAAPQLVKLINATELSAEVFKTIVTDDIVKTTNDDDSLLQFACRWVKGRLEPEWSEGVGAYTKILVHVISPEDNNFLKRAIGDAMTRLNEKKSFKSFFLDQNFVVGHCSREDTLKRYISDITLSGEQYVGVIGPDCSRSLESLSGVAEHYKHVVFSYMVDSVIDDSTKNQNYFFRIPPDTSVLAKAYVSFIHDMDWMNFAAFAESSYQGSAYMDNIRDTAITYSQNFHSMYYLSQIREKLINMKKQRLRIIIGGFPEERAGEVMCEAYTLNMTARNGYVWLLPFWVSEHSFERAKNTNCDKLEIREALEFTFRYHFTELADDNFITDYNETVLDWKRHVTRDNETLAEYAGFAYDAVWALGKSLGELFDERPAFWENLRSPKHNVSQSAFHTLANKINDTEFNGVSGVVKFKKVLRKPNDITLYQYCNGTWRHVSTYFLNATEKQKYNGIRWYDNVKPGDGTLPCVFQPIVDNLGVSCEGAIIMVVMGAIVGVIVLFGGVGLGFAYRHYEEKVKVLEQNQGSLFSLKEYQLPEESVRIYRPVGEGAFGKVYFGDYVDEDKKVTNVAVKAAKDPTNVNAKLELLSEAETMKQFNHENILRLIGVIVKHESKCQIVTEFMMYGNLKSYLQDRRHLVDKGQIGAALLTQMALDICRGLSYLASLDYVHGDLACRNLLVHESLTIKIGDFGFCKNLVDQGYYRIVRTGPMPVRWMSPELLQTGVYHKESDIWSFGIVIYEIITFGAYPYHDRNDNDVQEFIRKGGFPTLPQKVSSELEALLLRVWSFDKDDRPDAMEMFECLASNAELIHPCIEEGAIMNAESLERLSKGSNSHGSTTWASRNRVRRSDSYHANGTTRMNTMKIV